jgi:CBS domain containing-hemolysin-like protein
LGEGIWLCDARVNIEDLNEAIGSDFSNEEFDTLGGYVFDLFGKIPVKYEKVSSSEYDFIVQDMEGHKINLIKIIKKGKDLE